MRINPLKVSILQALMNKGDVPLGLLSRISREQGREVPTSTLYDAIAALREWGLVTYNPRPLPDDELADLAVALSNGERTPRGSGPDLVEITAAGKHVALLEELRELIPPAKRARAQAKIRTLVEAVAHA